MATYFEKNVVAGPCKIGIVDTEGAEIAALNANAAAGASEIVLTGLTLGVDVGDPIEIKDDNGSEFAVVRTVTENVTTTVGLLQKIENAYKTTDNAKAYKATRTDLGMTTEDGTRFGLDFETAEFFADQTRAAVLERLNRVTRTVALDFIEVTAEIMKIIMGMSEAPVGSAPEQTLVEEWGDNILPEYVLMITGPWVNSGYFRFCAHARVSDVGEITRQKNDIVAQPVTFKIQANPATDAFAMWTFSASDMA